MASILYILFKRPTKRNAIIQTQTGLFFSRKGTIDFQFANYAYEWSVKSFLLENYKNYDVFFDIGSNIGTYAILMGKLGMKVHAFEPMHNNFRALQINILLNNLETEVKAYNFGVGDADRTQDFIYEPVNTGASHYSVSVDNNGIHEMRTTKKLDSVMDQFGLNSSDKILMKVDVEGMEPNVFKGAKKMLSDFDNILIVFESKHSGFKNAKKVLDEIASFEYMKIDHYNSATKKSNSN